MNQLSISEYNPRMKYCDKFQFANLPFERGEIPFSKGIFKESLLMGQIANQMALELFFKIKERIKEKKKQKQANKNNGSKK
mgnify:CR=1 FL=1